MTDTLRLGLPLVAAGQSQKHVTVNEGLGILDDLVQLSVRDAGRTAPPAAPETGDRHLVGPDPTGAWTGGGGHVAVWNDAAWRLYAPRQGWVAYVEATSRFMAWDGARWRETGAASGAVDPFTGPFSSRARKRIVLGLDSLGGSGGQPGLADNLRGLLGAAFGDAGPGFLPLDHATIAGRLAGGDFAVSPGFVNIAALSWADVGRRRSLFGKGLSCQNAATAEAGSSDYLLLSGPSSDVQAIDLYFEWSAAGQSFRLRQWPTEVLDNAVLVSQADYPEIGVVHKLTFLLDVGGEYTGKGLNLEKIVCCDERIYFWAVEMHGDRVGHEGVQVLDIGTPSAETRDWASLDEARTRMWVDLLQADVFILNAGMNDRGASPQNDVEARRNAASFSHALQRVVERVQACARTRVLLVRPPDPADAATTAIRYHHHALKAVAWARGCAFLDERDALGDFTAADTAGFMSVDGVHPSTSGNARRAEAYAARLGNLGA